LAERDGYAQDTGLIEADVRVLRAILAECHEFLKIRTW